MRPRRPAAKSANSVEKRHDGNRAREGVVGAEDIGRSASEWIESADIFRVIRRAARQYGLKEDDLPDLLQETRIALWRAGLKSSVTAGWVFQTASHKAVDAVRTGIRRRARETRTAGGTPAPTPPDAELEYLLHARVDELPARLRQFYELRYRQGCSQREIARCLGVCRSSVRWLDRCCVRYIGGGKTGPARPIAIGNGGGSGANPPSCRFRAG